MGLVFNLEESLGIAMNLSLLLCVLLCGAALAQDVSEGTITVPPAETVPSIPSVSAVTEESPSPPSILDGVFSPSSPSSSSPSTPLSDITSTEGATIFILIADLSDGDNNLKSICNGCDADAEELRTEIVSFLNIPNDDVDILDYEREGGVGFEAMVRIFDTTRGGSSVSSEQLTQELETAINNDDPTLGPELRKVDELTFSRSSTAGAIRNMVAVGLVLIAAVFAL